VTSGVKASFNWEERGGKRKIMRFPFTFTKQSQYIVLGDQKKKLIQNTRN